MMIATCISLLYCAGLRQGTVPVDLAREVHRGCYGQEAGNRSDQQRIVFEAEHQIDHRVEQRENGEGASRLPQSEYPSSVCGEQEHSGCAAYQKSKIETDSFGQ